MRRYVNITVVALMMALVAALIAPMAQAAPELLLYHSFDEGLEQVDLAEGDVQVDASANLSWRENGVYGRSAGFDMGARNARLELSLGELAPSESWTLSFFLQLDAKEVMTQPDDRMLTVLDQHGDPMFHMNVSGGVTAIDAEGRNASWGCFDAIYWIEGENIHLTVSYDSEAASTNNPRGKLKAYWEARPYGAAYMDMGGRRPATIRFGGDDLAVAIDELHLFGSALPLPAVYELARPPRRDPAELNTRLAQIIEEYNHSTMAARRQAWINLAAQSMIFEAEAAPGANVVNGGNAVSASGRAYSNPGNNALTLPFRIEEAGEYALAIRYALDRRFDPMWPVRNPAAATPWTDSFTTVAILLNGEELSTERLYPTGTYEGHRGDVDPWAWHNIAQGGKVELDAGEHTIEIRPEEGLAWPLYDALMLAGEPGPEPPHPRWVDQYRTPPAWWVENREVDVQGGERIDTYTVTLRNRTDEPYAARISLEQDMLDEGQVASTDTPRVELAPHEEKAFEISFRNPADVAAKTGYLRVVLWNEDSPLPMEYRLWNVVPEEFHAARPHPRLLPEPDPQMQERFREWLVDRDPDDLTPELRQWAAGPARGEQSPEYRVLTPRMNLFPAPLLGDRLEILDMWMGMSEEELAAYLPKGPAENAGYGTCWNKVANKLTGVWHGQTFDYVTEPEAHVWKPEGDLDVVVTLHAKGRDWRAMRERREEIINEGTWHREEDADVFSAVRAFRWSMMAGMTYGNTEGDYPRHSGIPLLAEAYYLTGDEAYAQQAYKMARVFAREYTVKARQFLFNHHREDRNWWGSRWHNRYMAHMGQRVIQRLGTGVLDLCWNGLDEQQREVLNHNLIRFGMYEATYGPLWDDVDKGAKVNREDPPPFVPAGLVLGDPGPRRGLQDFFHLVNKMVLSDGVHICSIGSYGGVGVYIGFLRQLEELGAEVAEDNPNLRNAFLNHSRFVFACGSLQPMDDGGGGQNLLQLNATFGAPSREQYQWGYELFEDDLFLVMRDFLESVDRQVRRGSGEDRAERMRQFYAGHAEGLAGDGLFPVREIWPALFVAEDKGMAMLRNWSAEDPLDWIEVIFDYGKYGGRFHGHPTKLGILTAFNGQVGSQDYGDLTRNAPEGNNAWFMGGYSHNTVQVNYRHHRTAGGPIQIGELIEAGGDEATQWIDAHSDRMFDGVYMRRTTFVTDAGIVDFYLCESERENVYDWSYHNYGVADTEAALNPTDISGQGLLRFAEDARSALVDDMIQVIWEDRPLDEDPPRKGRTSLIGENAYARLWALPEEGTELLLFAGPTVPSINQERQIDYAMLRRKTDNTVFASVIEPWREETGPKIERVERVEVTDNGRVVSDTEAYAMKLVRVDGTEQIFLVNYGGGIKTVGNVVTDANLASWTIKDGEVVDIWRSEGAALEAR